MTNYTIGDADEILRELSKSQLIFSKHSFRRELKRDISEAYVKKMLFEIDPLDITRDKRNEFKLYYPSEKYQNKELIVVIAIDKSKKVIVQSVWEEKRYK